MAIAYNVPSVSKSTQEQTKPKVIQTFKVPLNSYTLATNTCWELIAKIFCYALRYHQLSAGGNGMLQISIEYVQPPPSSSDDEDNDDDDKN